MYGDPFGKSLCQAWAASPIYLLGRCFLGVRPLTPGYETYEVEPHFEYFEELDEFSGRVYTVMNNSGSINLSEK